MKPDKNILEMVLAAQRDNDAADELIRQYLPFIKKETAKFTHHAPVEMHDDELSIAMFAFHEAVMAYTENKGAFLSFASVVIKNRLIDHSRKESRHRGLISLDEAKGGEDDDRTILDSFDTGEDHIAHHTERSIAKSEILHFAETLTEYDLSLTDIADNCPKQERTLEACHRILSYARENPEILHTVETTKKLPIKKLSEETGIDRKLMERHRKYLIAILLAFTNGFEIIRGHLKQISPKRGGQRL